MTLSIHDAGLIRGLIYGVQFERDPVDAIDRVVEYVLSGALLRTPPREHLAAIRAALASDEQLAGLIPQDYHDEATIRRYLAELARRLEERLGRTSA
jgi:hypothetical protein